MLLVLIHNDETGTREIANYDWETRVNEDIIASGRVESFQRRLGWEALVRRVLVDAEGDA